MEQNMDKRVNRPIGENEEELLDQIWNSLPMGNEDHEEKKRGFLDVQQRIRRKRRTRLAYYASGVAASVCLIFFAVSQPISNETDTETVSPLQQIGLAVKDKEGIQLMVGDSSVTVLETSGRIEVGNEQKIALLSPDGKRIILQPTTQDLTINVPAGKQFELEMEDGTRVNLNAETRFKYPSVFAKNGERIVEIDGEGFFDVQRDTARPFRVVLPNGESIRVLGTSFNVSAYTDNEENVTTLLTGKIEYRLPGREKGVTLSPNEQVRVNRQTGDTKKEVVDARQYSSWKEGIIYFNEERLAVIAKSLERVYGIEIRVAEEHRNETFSAMIRYERGVEYFMELLSKTSNIKCKIEGGIIHLK